LDLWIFSLKVYFLREIFPEHTASTGHLLAHFHMAVPNSMHNNHHFRTSSYICLLTKPPSSTRTQALREQQLCLSFHDCVPSAALKPVPKRLLKTGLWCGSGHLDAHKPRKHKHTNMHTSQPNPSVYGFLWFFTSRTSMKPKAELKDRMRCPELP